MNPTRFDHTVWLRPPAEYSQCPFWFWNDQLSEEELLRQIGDFQAHGVEGFVIHPRIGLPRSIGFLSSEMFRFMRIALTEARRRGMWAILYDEGMYPSGSGGGLVVARDASFRVRGLTCLPLEDLDDNPAATDRRILATVKNRHGVPLAICDQKVDAVIRGLHYQGDETVPQPREDEYPAADLLNPAAVACFIEVVYDHFYAELKEFIQDGTVKAIFTDEPNLLGRLRTPNVQPGTTGILEHVNSFLGYDFTPHLPALWSEDEPDAERHRRNYARALAERMDETYYAPLYHWCQAHGVALTGHPAEPDEIGHLRHFQFPGQDIVWRHVEPNQPSALEGAPSTMAKAAASIAFHLDRPRNLNEFAGAFGPELTFRELQWLASWLLIRGCNLLSPHAFYYSMRGPRGTERPPDVGPNNIWWPDYKPWADATRRLCWLNATGTPVCHLAILGDSTRLPWAAAKACFENQIDFHYIEPADLQRAEMKNGCLCIGRGRYTGLVIEAGYEVPAMAGLPLVAWEKEGLEGIRQRVAPVVELDQPAPGLRVRHLVTDQGTEVFLFFNEGEDEVIRQVRFPVSGKVWRLDPVTGDCREDEDAASLIIPAHGWKVAVIEKTTPAFS